MGKFSFRITINKYVMYKVKNIKKFVNKLKKISCDNFMKINDSINDEISEEIRKIKDFDSIINEEEIKNIAIPFINRNKTISESSLIKIIEDINNRIISNSISKLVSNGCLESAYDEEENDFIFWKV